MTAALDAAEALDALAEKFEQQTKDLEAFLRRERAKARERRHETRAAAERRFTR